MDFVDLKRSFVSIGRDQEANFEVGRIWGHRVAGWLGWTELLEYRRVVLLAEASSGKTEEFRHQVGALTAQGRAAFFVTIEDLADDGFEDALEPAAVTVFHRWREDGANEEGWFFLDSVDEARLNHKSPERALRRFARALGQGLERARVYISCRVSDWRGPGDRAAIERLLPMWEQPSPLDLGNEDAALLGPIFANKNETRNAVPVKEPEHKPEDLLVVQLVPLTAEQRRALAAAAGVERMHAFVEGIERHGLDALAERPGDPLDLAEYWNNRHRFGSLVEMTEQGVTRKLTERDKFRPDNRDLSLERTRQGAERLAAALTLAKSLTLRAPGHDPDPTLAAGAVDPVSVLDDWADAQRNALIRRGVFAPSTYGRVRFHHRATQEYLTAKWLNRLLQAGSPRDAVWELIFADRYGIETLVPSLHGTAAWLALDHPDIRDEIIRREPLVLLCYGDSRSLPSEAKERLLLTYAEHHLAGEIGNDSLDHRALWMFATPDLADAIRRSWTINDRRDFRIDLLRIVREGAIRACVDLAREAVLDEAGDDYLRMVAMEAVDACGDVDGLGAAARWLVAASAPVTARLASHFAKVLFPRYLSVDELLELIERSPSPKERSYESFGHAIGALWGACPDAAARERFIAGFADLCLAPPFAAPHLRISARHYGLVANMTALGREAVLALRDAEPCDGLVRLLMVIERAESHAAADQEGPPLSTLVSTDPRLQRRLFWADIEETRRNASPGDDHPIRFWQVHVNGGRLWRPGLGDLSWLYEDLATRPLEADRRVALSAIVAVLTNAGTLDAEAPRLRTRVAGRGELETDLNAYLAPPVESEEALRRRQSATQRQWEEKERKDKAS
jgi:hypothetical protein